MSLIRKHVAVLQAWACLDLVINGHIHAFIACCILIKAAEITRLRSTNFYNA